LVRWAEYMRGDAPSGSAFPYVRVRGHVALVGVNSAIETAPLQAVGRVGEDQRSRLGALLTALGREGLVRVVMIHHPPLPGQAKPAKALMDAAALQALLATAGAELVIHGHNHRSMHARIARDAAHSIPVVGIPSASARRSHNGDDLARAHIFHIARDGAIRLESRGLRIADGPVEALSVETLAGD
jgi:3',5'-cyclic AMP phosphodiesterase CpdA